MAQFEKEFMKKQKLSITDNFRMVDALYDEALALGAFGRKSNFLQDIDIPIKIARVVNNVSEAH